MINRTGNSYITFESKRLLFEEEEAPLVEIKIQTVALSALECLTLAWYHFLFLLTSLFSSDSYQTHIFEGNAHLIPTCNQGKKKDLSDYARMQPPDPSDKTLKVGALLCGFSLGQKKKKINPITGGKCFGAVAHFFQETLKGDIQKASEDSVMGYPWKP